MPRFFVSIFIIVVLLVAVSGEEVLAQFTISGTVTGPGATPQTNVDVFLYDDQGNPLGGPSIVTNGSGFYTISGLPADTYGAW